MMNVYFHEFQLVMNQSVYLPLSTACLRAYSETFDEINNNYSFQPFIFIKQSLDDIVNIYKEPSVAAFSSYMWNMNLNLAVAKTIRNRFPGCLIVFGGPSVPCDTVDFLNKNSSIDIVVKGEGEISFSEILKRFITDRDFNNIPLVSWRDRHGFIHVNNKEHQFSKNLLFPSPYLLGVFDYIIKDNKYEYQAIVETNRGCPFKCSFCFWGKGTKQGKKYRFFDLDNIKKFAEWCGHNAIKYVFCADSNFGIFPRDFEIANYFAETKQKYGFPDKFRVCYAKNSEENVFKVASLLHKFSMEKSISLSRQSNNETTLQNISRKNIKSNIFRNLSLRYAATGIPVYSEFIIGLPGETYESFKKGIEETLQQGFSNQIFIYLCQVLPNTELALPDYMKKFEIQTATIPLTPIHGNINNDIDMIENDEIVIGTYSLTINDWRRLTRLAWVFSLLHGLKCAYYILAYVMFKNCCVMNFIERIMVSKPESTIDKVVSVIDEAIDKVISGKGTAVYVDGTLPIYWSPEEAAFFKMSDDAEGFYSEILTETIIFFNDNKVKYEYEEIEDVIKYQKLCVPTIGKSLFSDNFRYDMHDFFSSMIKGEKAEITKKPGKIAVSEKIIDSQWDLSRHILWGRKSGMILLDVVECYGEQKCGC